MKNMIVKFSIIMVLLFMLVGCGNKFNLEVLEDGLRAYKDSSLNSKKYDIEVRDKIIVTDGDLEYLVNYNLDEMTFYNEILVKNGMSYEEYMDKIEKIKLSGLGYYSYAYAKGISFNDSSKYFNLVIDENVAEVHEEDEVYAIVDDKSEVEDDEDIKIIEKKDFGKYVVEYTKYMYKNKLSIMDSYEYDTFKYEVELLECSNDTCTIGATLTIKKNADFSKLDGYSNVN